MFTGRMCDGNVWKLSPSDFSLLWEECPRCFYMKVVRSRLRPRSPMPGVFNKIDAIEKAYFAGMSTKTISRDLPHGSIEFGEKWVTSGPIKVPGHRSSCFIHGKFDVAARFSDGTYGIIDFKTSEARDPHVPLYSRQLHAYAYALEHPGPGRLKLSPVSRLGLLCVAPVELTALRQNGYAFKMSSHWIEVRREDDQFMLFLGEVMDILDRDEAPAASTSCQWCVYLATANDRYDPGEPYPST